MHGLEHDEDRRSVWLVVNEQADTELQSLGRVLATTARHCPEYLHLWDAEVGDIMGGELLGDQRSLCTSLASSHAPIVADRRGARTSTRVRVHMIA